MTCVNRRSWRCIAVIACICRSPILRSITATSSSATSSRHPSSHRLLRPEWLLHPGKIFLQRALTGGSRGNVAQPPGHRNSVIRQLADNHAPAVTASISAQLQLEVNSWPGTAPSRRSRPRGLLSRSSSEFSNRVGVGPDSSGKAAASSMRQHSRSRYPASAASGEVRLSRRITGRRSIKTNSNRHRRWNKRRRIAISYSASAWRRAGGCSADVGNCDCRPLSTDFRDDRRQRRGSQACSGNRCLHIKSGLFQAGAQSRSLRNAARDRNRQFQMRLAISQYSSGVHRRRHRVTFQFRHPWGKAGQRALGQPRQARNRDWRKPTPQAGPEH